MGFISILDLKYDFSFPKEKNLSDQQNESSTVLKDQQVLDVKSYAHLFSKSVETLRLHLAEKGDGAELIWDKVSSACLVQILIRLIQFNCKWYYLEQKHLTESTLHV